VKSTAIIGVLVVLGVIARADDLPKLDARQIEIVNTVRDKIVERSRTEAQVSGAAKIRGGPVFYEG